MELKLADLFDSQQLGGLIEILGELRDGMDVAAHRVGTKVPAPEFLQHPLTKWGHRTLLSVTETTARYRPKHPRNCVRPASGLVLTRNPDKDGAVYPDLSESATIRSERLPDQFG